MSINLNTARNITTDEIKQVMDYHPWNEQKIAQGKLVKDALSEALRIIIENVPPCPDRSAAIRKLRDCRMDCNSALTHDGNF